MTGRPFIKIDHEFPDHRKTVELSDRAFRELVTAWCYCARTENDGSLSNAQVSRLFSRKVVKELSAVGYLDKTPTGWEMHDYLDHQTSAAHMADLRRKRSEAGRRGGKARANTQASASPVAKQTGSKIQPEVEVEVEEEEQITTTTELHPSAAPMTRTRTVDAEFEEFWTAYPRKVGKDGARRAFANALRRRSATAREITLGAARFAADPNRDATFTPHPQTWLNAGRWSDEPCAPRQAPGARPSTTDARMTDALDLAAQLRAEEQANTRPARLELAR